LFSSFYRENPICDFIYENTNPFFLFVLALLSSIKNMALIIIHNPWDTQLPKHIAKFTVLKVIPLIYLYHQKIKVFENLVFSVLSFFAYLFYLFAINENVFSIYKELENQIKNNESNTTLEYYIDNVIQFFTKK
jgi:hypothetical protein